MCHPIIDNSKLRYNLTSSHPELIAVKATLVRVRHLPRSAGCRLVPETTTTRRNIHANALLTPFPSSTPYDSSFDALPLSQTFLVAPAKSFVPGR